MSVSGITRGRLGVGASLVALLAAAVLLLVLPAAASAQTAAGADEYIPDDPGCSVDMGATVSGTTDCPDDKDVKGDNDTGVPSSDDDGDSEGLLASTSGGDGGSLPFTGYPLTSMVLVALALLLAGALLRAGIALRERTRASGLNTAA
jgi:hypothetical protein